MHSKPTFVQRLLRQSSSRERCASKEPTSLEKKVAAKEKTQNSRFNQFKEQHNELKNMLKLFDHPKSQALVQITSFSPTRSRKTQKHTDKNVLAQFDSFKIQPIKENVSSMKWRLSLKDEAKSPYQVAVAKTEPIVRIPEEQLTVRHSKKKGIPNIGNTCYINALVQCLFHLPHFNDYFFQEKYLAQRNGKNKNIVGLYKDLYTNVMRKNSQAEVSTLPLKRSVSTLCCLFMDWEQEDAHEFMKQLLNSIHQDINRIICRPNYKLMSKPAEGTSLQKMAFAFWDYCKQRDDSYIYDCLCGQLYNNIRCINCTQQSECFQNFLDLSVPMAPEAKSLQDLLQNFFQPQKLSDYYLCANCNRSSKKSTKTMQLWRAPPFLILHLKRSQFGNKNIDAITIPECLNLKRYMNLSNDRSAKYCQYSLCGVIMHRGVLEGGHYWCNVKENGQWFQIDDEKVTQLDTAEFKKDLTQKGSSSAYILFYSSLYR